MSNIKAETEAKLAEAIARFYDDPLGFVMFVFPWGEQTTFDGRPNPLKDKKGPEDWQRRVLVDLGEHIRENIVRKEIGLDLLVWRSATTSGHGVGKSALVAWLNIFLMSTRPDTRGVVTANTGNQLETKTWPELAKWLSLALNKHWFDWTAKALTFAPYPEEKKKNYMVNALTVSEENTEAFAGLHNEGKTVFAIFDEASGIVSKIWEVVDGALTDGEAFFFAFGNPTRPDGDFADCFDKHKDLYHLYQVDSREVSHTNKVALQQIIDKYGADSDEARIRVYGQFPNQAYNGFIPVHVAEDAIKRDLYHDSGAALIMAIDVARFGDDETVIGYRQGRDFRSRPMKSFKGLPTTKIADIATDEINRERPDAIVIESTGPGAGVIDQLRERGFKVVEVHPGAAADKYEQFFNKRAELWSKGRDWLIENGCIPDDKELKDQLTSILYTLDRHEQRLQMEAKKDMKKRGLPSPDRADTLMLTFAAKVARRDMSLARNGRQSRRRQARTEYDPIMHE